MSAQPLLRLNNMPVYQNKMFYSREAAIDCPSGTIELVADPRYGIVCNRAYDPRLLQYDQSYQNEQGGSSVFQAHLQEVLEKFDRYFYGKKIAEVGCGKALFLEKLSGRGYSVVGIDPAYEGDLPYVIKSTFKSDLHVNADVIVLRHVLEHIQDPVNFLKEIAHANQGRGLVYIEVPCLEWILSQRAWFDIFYEHVNYFSAENFRRIFDGQLEVSHLFGGQYLSVIADLEMLRLSGDDVQRRGMEVPPDFFSQIERIVEALLKQQAVAVWGGGAKGMMFAHHMLQRGVNLQCAIDINPLKQGKYLAGSGLKVLSPANALAELAPGSTIFIMNPNYSEEIKAMAGSGFEYIVMEAKSEL